MKFGVAKNYIKKYLFGGIGKDSSSQLDDPNKGMYNDCHGLRASIDKKNILSEYPKEVLLNTYYDRDGSTVYNIHYPSLIVLYLVPLSNREILVVNFSNSTKIFINHILCADSNQLPSSLSTGGYISETDEFYITDNVKYPMIFKVSDLLTNRSTEKYFTEFNPLLYTFRLSNQINQVVFAGLETIGNSLGLRCGTYSYSFRYKSSNGEATAWSPYCPMIPVPLEYNGSYTDLGNGIMPGYNTIGGLNTDGNSPYGIRLRMRINNDIGFDWIELKRLANNSGAPIGFTNTPEYIQLSTDANGALIDIKNNPYQIIEFVDSSTVQWLPYDESEVSSQSAIAKAKTIRYYNNVLLLGNITYESRVISNPTQIFKKNSNNDIGHAIKENLGFMGYNDINNQVYKKSLRCGEVYGFAVKFYDDSGNTSFCVPYKGDVSAGIYDLTSYQIPNRRDLLTSSVWNYSKNPVQASLKNSNAYDAFDYCYDVVSNPKSKKYSESVANILNNVSKDYIPLTPTGNTAGYAGNGDKVYGLLGLINTELDSKNISSSSYGAKAFLPDIIATGMVFMGIDTTKLPSWVKGFSIVRTKPAGRVVCQGLGMYSLQETTGTTNGVLKNLNKIWFYSPELDSNIGDKTYLYDDIKNNPQNYKIQLVAPIGFFTEFYNDIYDDVHTTHGEIDMVSYARVMQETETNTSYPGYINPYDYQTNIGRGSNVNGAVTFGRWRNYKGIKGGDNDDYMASAIYADSTYSYIFEINAFDLIPYISKNSYGNVFEISLGSSIYAKAELKYQATSNDDDVRLFHEPFYIVNIIREDATIGNNNINTYYDIGHYQKLESFIGYSNGQEGQEFYIVDEREEDFKSGNTAYTAQNAAFIKVDNKWWYDASVIEYANPSAFSTYLNDLQTNGYVTINSRQVYGFYKAIRSSQGYYSIKFPYSLPNSTKLIPANGSKLYVCYNSDRPIKLFLGDTVIGDAVFPVIDLYAPHEFNSNDTNQWFRIMGAMPVYRAKFSSTYIRPKNPLGTKYETADLYLQYLRQWLMVFTCESTVNLPFRSGNFFPHRHYVLRPDVFTEKRADQTEDAYLTSLKIYTQYAIDYPQEYVNWRRGGFCLDQQYNFDYSKDIGTSSISMPAVGFTENLNYSKRLVWTKFKNNYGYINSIPKSIPITNYYDINNLECKNIVFLWDTVSDKGNNLYAFTDKGIILLLTKKNILSDATGDTVSINLSQGTFISGEYVLNSYINIPLNAKKAEGGVFMKGVYVPALAFNTSKDIFVMIGNSLFSILNEWKNNFEKIIPEAYSNESPNGVYLNPIFMVFNTLDNELWVQLNSISYTYNFGMQNWSGKIAKKYLAGYSTQDYFKVLGLNIDGYIRSFDISRYNTGDIVVMNDVDSDFMYKCVDIPVNVIQSDTYEFIDLFINSNVKPTFIKFSTSQDYSTDYAIVYEPNIYKYASSIWYTVIPRAEDSAKRMQSNVLYVKVYFKWTDSVEFSSIKVGFNPMIGG